MTTPRSNLRLRTATTGDAPLLDNLWLMFRHDMSAITGTLPDAAGRFRDERLRSALTDPAWRATLAYEDDSPAGFAIVRALDEPVRVLNSFFVVSGARRRGIGRAVARGMVERDPGKWEIPFQETNAPAAAFWRAVATDVAGRTWTVEQRPVPGRPDLPPDAWLRFRV